jgi:multidrug efflux system membrane fusion protein
MHEVTVGPTTGNETVISSGLTVDQLVVIEGADKLVNGAKVVLQDDTKPQPNKKMAKLMKQFIVS